MLYLKVNFVVIGAHYKVADYQIMTLLYVDA